MTRPSRAAYEAVTPKNPAKRTSRSSKLLCLIKLSICPRLYASRYLNQDIQSDSGVKLDAANVIHLPGYWPKIE